MLREEKMYGLYSKIATIWPIRSTKGEEWIVLIPEPVGIDVIGRKTIIEHQLP
jgi:hypothetical protein